MKQDQRRWNKRYSDGDFPTKPSEIVKEFYGQAPLGRALDIAAGKGRNSIFLAEQGFAVDALDISERALSGLIRHPGVTPVCVDFDVFDVARERYSLIVDVRFLNRRLFPQIMEGLVIGGVLIFETYLEHTGYELKGPEDTPPADTGKKEPGSCREFMLRPNELLHAFMPLRILHYREIRPGDSHDARPLASLVAVKTHRWR